MSLSLTFSEVYTKFGTGRPSTVLSVPFWLLSRIPIFGSLPKEVQDYIYFELLGYGIYNKISTRILPSVISNRRNCYSVKHDFQHITAELVSSRLDGLFDYDANVLKNKDNWKHAWLKWIKSLQNQLLLDEIMKRSGNIHRLVMLVNEELNHYYTTATLTIHGIMTITNDAFISYEVNPPIEFDDYHFYEDYEDEDEINTKDPLPV